MNILAQDQKLLLRPEMEVLLMRLLETSRSGFIFDDVNSVYAFLCNEYDKFIEGREVSQVDSELRMQFSRESQAIKLGLILNKI